MWGKLFARLELLAGRVKHLEGQWFLVYIHTDAPVDRLQPSLIRKIGIKIVSTF